MMMPVLVSPILMVDVSTAAMRVSLERGISASGWRFSCRVMG